MRFALFISFLLILPMTGQAEKKLITPNSFMIVVNIENEVDVINYQELSMIYLGKKTLWRGDVRIAPAMLYERKYSMCMFLEQGLGKTLNQYRAYWKRRLFSGGGTIPRTFRTSTELIDYISKKPGAIGVLPADTKIPERLKILKIEVEE